MRTSTAVLLILLSAAWLRADDQAKAAFLASNPDYRARAGKFYEEKYLPDAVKGLTAALAPAEISQDSVRSILKDYIYAYLDQMIEDGGQISRRGNLRLLKELDSKINNLTANQQALANYEAWKPGDKPEFPNPLNFLVGVSFHPLQPTLTPELTDMGWSVRSIFDLDEVAHYADILGLEPCQVFIFEKKADAPAQQRTLTLLLYNFAQTDRLLKSADALKKAEHDKADEKPVPRLFWRLSGFVVFILEPPPSPETETLKDFIRKAWATQ